MFNWFRLVYVCVVLDVIFVNDEGVDYFVIWVDELFCVGLSGCVFLEGLF